MTNNTQPDSATADHESIAPARLRAMLADGKELALLDVRENGVYSAGHLFAAASLPFSKLELQADAMLPRRDVRMVLVDGGEGLAERAAARLANWGYSNIALLAGGLPAWQGAGFSTFSGVYVPSKAFGEFVEHACGTPAISAATLTEWKRDGKDMLMLDSRPYEEFHRYSLPGGVACPGAELVHRAFGLIDNETTTIVVNCAGRTRGIIGAQALINAGMRNPVVVVENGTAGWYLNGGELAEGRTEVAPPASGEGLQKAITASQHLVARFGVSEIDSTQLATLRARADRSLYLLDVRTPDEYLAGHLQGSRSAPGGQLVQSTDHYVGVRNACLVLVDDNGVRARVTASWLVQMGWKDVHVLRNGLHAASGVLHKGREARTVLGAAPQAESISAFELAHALERNEAVVVDLDSSLLYRDSHIAGAWFAVRSRLQTSLATLPPHRMLVLTSGDGSFAALAAADAQAASQVPVRVLQGGTAAWRAAGLPSAKGLENMADRNDDVWYSPYDHDDRAAAMKAYLKWEVDLLDQIRDEGSADFSCSPVARRPTAA